MDPTTLAALLAQCGYGAYVPVVLAVIGLASAIATVYPPNWPGAPIVRGVAMLFGHAKPATPTQPTPVPAAKALLILFAMGIALSLSACGDSAATQQVVTTLNTGLSDIQKVAAGSSAILNTVAADIPALEAIVPLSTAQQTTLNTAVAAIKSANSLIASAQSISDPTVAGALKTIEANLNTLVAFAAADPALPIPAQIRADLVIASVALPPAEALLGLAVQQGTALAASINANALTPATTTPGASPAATPAS
jgi:hypothetical protein